MKADDLRQGEVGQPGGQQLDLLIANKVGQRQVAEPALHRLPSIDPNHLRQWQVAQPGCQQLHPPIATRLWGWQVAKPRCRQLQLPGELLPACRPGGIDHRPELRSVHAHSPYAMRLRRCKDRPYPRQHHDHLRLQTGR
jgi:hypothetical protein